MMIFTLLFLFIPLFYLFLISITEREENEIVKFSLSGGLLILVIYMFTLIFVESNDKPTYLGYFLNAENYYGNDKRDLLWGALQIFLSKFMVNNELLYWLFYSVIYCMAYYAVARKYFPSQYSGYFVLCVVGCMGFVSYGSNTIRAGFGIALLLMAFCSERLLFRCLFAIAAIGNHITMLIPVVGFLVAKYVLRKVLWCELVWILFLLISARTSLLSDIMTLAGGLDVRAEGFSIYDEIGSYQVGFRIDFIIYSLLPVFFVKYNMMHLNYEDNLYNSIYRTYLLINALWLLLIRAPYSDRFAYLSWFMIPFLLMYPVLNEQLDTQRPQRYVLSAIGIFFLVNAALMLKSS